MSVATRVGRVPSAKEYALHARELNYPSLPTVLNRMGGWTHALRAAGMDPLSAAARARKRRWTEEACWTALRKVVRELGEIPTVLAYERHAAGRAELPSSATLRNRLGRWSAITTQLAAQASSSATQSAARRSAARRRAQRVAARSRVAHVEHDRVPRERQADVEQHLGERGQPDEREEDRRHRRPDGGAGRAS